MEILKPNNVLELFNPVSEFSSHLASKVMCAANIIHASSQVGEFPPYSPRHRYIIYRRASLRLSRLYIKHHMLNASMQRAEYQ